MPSSDDKLSHWKAQSLMQTDLWHSSFKPTDAASQRATIIWGRSFGLFETLQVNWFEIYYSPHQIDVHFLLKRAKHARTLRLGSPSAAIAVHGWDLPPIGEANVPMTSTTDVYDGTIVTTTKYPSFVIKAGDTIDDELRRLAEGPYSQRIDKYLSELPKAIVLADFRRFRRQPWSQSHDKKVRAFTTRLSG